MKKTERLECKTGGSNKYYEFVREYKAKRFTVTGYFGAIGQAPKENVLYDGDSEEDAEKEYKKKYQEKIKKQYLPVGTINSTISPIIVKASGDMPVVWLQNAKGVSKTDGDKQFEKLMKDDRYIAQEKLDGMRVGSFIHKAGMRLFSRNGGVDDPTKPLEKTQSVPHLAELVIPNRVGTIFDSEIIVDGLDSANIAGTVNSHSATEGETLAKLHIFDLLYVDGIKITHLTLEKRLKELALLKKEFTTEYTVVVPYAVGEVAKRALLEEVMARGGEGIMFKNLDAVYDEGSRHSNNWYKFKKSIRVDCVGMGFTKGQGKYNKQIGAFIFGQYINGVLTEIGQTSGMTDAIRLDMTKHPNKYIGHAVVIKGMERLKSNAIRHPQFAGMHDDKRPEDCIMYDDEQ